MLFNLVNTLWLGPLAFYIVDIGWMESLACLVYVLPILIFMGLAWNIQDQLHERIRREFKANRRRTGGG